MNQHIYLTGYRGTGKTSVGRILSATLSLPLVDLDDLIEQVAGKSIRQIFADGGEESFRDYESRCLSQVSQQPASVVSLGGGAILREANRRSIAETGACVWLVAGAETLVARIAADDGTGDRRPALTSLPEAQEVQKMLTDREPLYRAAADHQVDTENKSIEQVAAEILAWLRE